MAFYFKTQKYSSKNQKTTFGTKIIGTVV